MSEAESQSAAQSQIAALLEDGMACHRAGNLPIAGSIYRSILKSDPTQADALHLLGLLSHRAGKYEEALQLFEKAIEVNPAYEVYYSSRGNTLRVLQRYELALRSFDEAIRRKPGYADAHYNRGLLMQQMKHFDAAVESYTQAIAFNPALADAYINRGNSLRALHRYSEALKSFAQAAQIQPTNADAFCNSANLFLETHQYHAAVVACNKALELDPSLCKAFVSRGIALQALKLFPQALDSFEQALRLDRAVPYLDGMCLHMKRHVCRWDNSEADLLRIETQVRQGKRVITPYCMLTVSNSLELQKKVAETHIADICPAIPSLTHPSHPKHRKLRIGYFSSDFRNHPVAWLMAQVFELHDRSRFEVFGFSTGPDTKDEMRIRTSSAMDHFFDLQSASDHAIVELSRSCEIDIAIDLNGLSYGDRTNVFAQRAAPIQVNYLGYPGTMGANFIDYIVADQTLIPEACRSFYTEKIVYLPDCFQANDSTRPVPELENSRTRHDLPEAGFVYCCFSNNVKITTQTFDLWMSILSNVPRSVLWLVQGNPQASANLRQHAEDRAIDSQRLIFAPPASYAEHLSRQTLADLFLDTLPFNAGATASSALWAGLPVLTELGQTFGGRMAASMLKAIRMPELITQSILEYRDLAIAIGNDPAFLKSLKQKLSANRLLTPLFDTASFIAHLESAFCQMHDRHHAGMLPDHLIIPTIAP